MDITVYMFHEFCLMFYTHTHTHTSTHTERHTRTAIGTFKVLEEVPND